MSRTRVSCLVVLLVAAGFAAPGATASEGDGPDGARPTRDLVVIDTSAQDLLQRHDVPVTWKGASFFLAEWDAVERRRARRLSVPFRTLARDMNDSRELYLFELQDDVVPPEAWSARLLLQRGRRWLLEIGAADAERWAALGYPMVRVTHRARGWSAPAARAAFACDWDADVAELLARSGSAQWLDWIEKLSGEEPVVVGSTERWIRTRGTSAMFSGLDDARGFDFAVEQMQAWHYPPGNIEVHEYSGSGGQTWSNLIATIPGQTSPGEIVLITGHLDSTSGSASTLAPGANDNGTGIAVLFEAARVLRQFRFERTIKIVWFSGEEQGLWGSEAYVAEHPLAGFMGAVNLDMFGWDGDGDRCFEIHAGTLTQSQDVGNCFRDSATAYAPALSEDFLTAGATDRSDHKSFWDVNVGAIEIAENYFNDGLPGGCVGSDANPHYHTTDDTISLNLTPLFAHDIARSGLATIAAMAVPLGACFQDVPAVVATPGVAQVDLDWSSAGGAASYRIFRSTQGCEGQWLEIAETPSTSWIDVDATEPTTYFYHVEAVDADGFCVSTMSNCVTAAPTIYHASNAGPAVTDVCVGGGPGAGDGILDPGESVLLPVSLQNDGNADLDTVTGLLSVTTPGVAVLDPSAAWPDLDAGLAAQSLPNHFGLQLDAGVPCGAWIDGLLDLSYAQGANSTGVGLLVGDTQQTLLLSEDFSGGIPAGWTVVDGGSGGGLAATWTDANPGGRTPDPPFAAPFAIVDSDEAGTGATQDEQLITPSFDAGACVTLTLEFASQFHHYSGGQSEIADVDVSTDGGVGWNNALRITGSDDGFPDPGVEVVDLSALVAPDPSSVTLRFRYHQASYEWWWALDDVQVRCAYPVCRPCAASAAAPGEPRGLRLQRIGGDLVFDWSSPMGCTIVDSALYRGDLPSLSTTGYDHDTALTCSGGATSFGLAESDPRLGDADYYLVVAGNGLHEGSYGRDATGSERPASNTACHPAQNLLPCP